ncbi:hypothetical protein EMIT048CA2_160134 [Pseudomonas chlororaphis]
MPPLFPKHPTPIVFTSADSGQRQGFAAQQKESNNTVNDNSGKLRLRFVYGGCAWETSGSAGFVSFLGLRTRVQLPPS